MKHMKRTIALLLSVLLLISGSINAFAENDAAKPADHADGVTASVPSAEDATPAPVNAEEEKPIFSAASQVCAECGGKANQHIEGCSKFVSEEPEACAECGEVEKHLQTCSKYVPEATEACAECGEVEKHLQTCSKYVPETPEACTECGFTYGHRTDCPNYQAGIAADEDADYSADKGKYAKLNEADKFPTFDIKYEEPTSLSDLDVADKDAFADVVFEITGVKVLEDTYTALWYKVNIIEGEVTDDDAEKYANGFWILQNYLDENAYPENILTLMDPPTEEPEDPEEPEKPEVPEAVAVITIDGIEASATQISYDCDSAGGTKTLSVQTNLKGELTYSWQACKEGNANGEWGALGSKATFDLSRKTLTPSGNYYWSADNYTAQVRVVVSNGKQEATAELTVVIKEQKIIASVPGGSVSVTGKALPEGATLSATVPAITRANLPGVFDIKVMVGEEEWQPDSGESVTLSIPVEGTDISINHFVDHVNAIHDGLTFVPLEGASAEELALLNPAIDAYEQKFGNRDYVAVEIIKNVCIQNGFATFTTNSFSLFTSYQNPTTEVESYNIEELDGQTLYVRPGEWFKLTTEESGFLSQSWSVGNNAEGNGVIRTIDGGGSRILFWGSSDNSYYIHVNEVDNNNITTVGQSFTVTFKYRIILSTEEYTIRVNIVNDFDWDNTYITLLPHTSNYPNEPTVYTGNSNYRFYSEGELATVKTIYTQFPRTLIDVDSLNHADVESDTEKLVYAIVDEAGADTEVYLKDAFDAIAADMLSEYVANTPNIIGDNYKIVVYAIKHETVGDNSGWYICCKVDLKDTFVLSYDYNEPSGFNAMDHLQGDTKKPQAQSIPTRNENGDLLNEVTATVASGSGMKLQYTVDKTDYTADFVGWSTNPNDTPSDCNDSNPNYYAAGETIRLREDTTLYAIWSTTKPYNSADVTFQNLIVNPKGGYVSSDDDFTFTASDNMNCSYIVYSSSGVKQGEGSFAESKDVVLKGGGYIIIDNVPNGNYSFTLKSYNETAYAPGTSPLTFGYTKDTNTSGKYTVTFVNSLKQFTVTWKTDSETVLKTELLSYGDVITAPTNPVKAGYTFAAWAPTIPAAMPASNLVFTATWTENNAILHYDVVGPEGASNFGIVTVESEEIPVVTGIPEGSTAQPGSGYIFKGWYADAECTVLIGEDESFVPTKAENEIWEETTYYAKFDYGYTDLKISTNSTNAGQSFIVTIRNNGETVTGETIELQVALQGGETVTIQHLPFGTYQVTLDSGWSWRYSKDTENITLNPEADNQVTLKPAAVNVFWLSGDCFRENQFTVNK